MAEPRIGDALLDYLRDEFGLPDDLTCQSPLFSSGLLSSTEVLRLVSVLETKFGASVPLNDVTEEHFDSVARITAYLSTASSGRPEG